MPTGRSLVARDVHRRGCRSCIRRCACCAKRCRCDRRCRPLPRRDHDPCQRQSACATSARFLRDDERASFNDADRPDRGRHAPACGTTPRFDVVAQLYSLKNRVRLRLKAGVQRRRAGAVARAALERGELARARVLRHVRHRLRGTSEPDAGFCLPTTGTKVSRCARIIRCAAGKSSRRMNTERTVGAHAHPLDRTGGVAMTAITNDRVRRRHLRFSARMYPRPAR